MRSVTLLVVGVLVAAVGCSSDGFDPSGPGGTPIGGLTPEQNKTLCIESYTYVQAALPPAAKIEYACRVEGIQTAVEAGSTSDAALRAYCKVGYDACKRNPPEVPPEPAPETACADGLGTSGTCAATVDEFAACVNETLGAYSRYFVPCSQLTNAKVEELLLIDQGPACKRVAQVCPDSATSALMTSSALRLEK